jgi:hypothetical protein
MVYVISVLSIAPFPLAVAGYGGHLAAKVLDRPERRKALATVWALAVVRASVVGAAAGTRLPFRPSTRSPTGGLTGQGGEGPAAASRETGSHDVKARFNREGPMTIQSSPPERWMVGLLALIGLSAFFFPLVSLRVPIAGDQDFSGYDVVSKAKRFGDQLRPARLSERETPNGQSDTGNSVGQQPTSTSSSEKNADVALSMRMSWLIPVFIAGAFLSALLTVVGALFSLRLSWLSSLAGAILGAASTIHLKIINSDIHMEMQRNLSVRSQDLKDNPFAGFAETLGKALLNSFKLQPAFGLYLLTCSLILIAIMVKTRVLSRLRLVSCLIVIVSSYELAAKKPKPANPMLSQIHTVFVKGNNEATVKARENLEDHTCYHLAPAEAKADAVLELDWSVRGGRVSGTLTTKDGEVVWTGVSSGETFRSSYGHAGEEVNLLFRRLQNAGWPGSVKSFHGLDKSFCGS